MKQPPAKDADLGTWTPAYLVWAFEELDDEAFKKQYGHSKSFCEEHYQEAKIKVEREEKRRAKIEALKRLDEEDGIDAELPTTAPAKKPAANSDIEPPVVPVGIKVAPDVAPPPAPELPPVAKPRKATPKKGAKRA